MPTIPKPAIIIAQVPGSGIAAVPSALKMEMFLMEKLAFASPTLSAAHH